MKVSDAITHEKYYANHQMIITKLQTFNDPIYTKGTEKSLRILKSTMENRNWFFNEIKIPRFNFDVDLDKNQIVTYSEFMFGTQVNWNSGWRLKDFIYNSMVDTDEDYGFKDFSLENFIERGTKPLGKDEPPWDLAYVDLEAFCECTKKDREKAFKTYEELLA